MLVYSGVTLSLYSTATQNTCQNFALEIPTCWYLGANAKLVKFASPPTQNLKFALPPTPTPDASQWNLGGIGSSGIGHVYFMYITCIFHVYFMYISCCLCIIFPVGYAKISRRKGRFQWNMGFRGLHITHLNVHSKVNKWNNIKANFLDSGIHVLAISGLGFMLSHLIINSILVTTIHYFEMIDNGLIYMI